MYLNVFIGIAPETKFLELETDGEEKGCKKPLYSRISRLKETIYI